MSKIVCSNLVERDGAYLLVRETKVDAAGLYNFPAGTVEDETLQECAIREAREESGLDVEIRGIVGVYRKQDFVIFVFASERLGGELTTSDEHPEVRYVTGDAIRRMEEQGELRSEYIVHAVERYRDGTVFDTDILATVQ